MKLFLRIILILTFILASSLAFGDDCSEVNDLVKKIKNNEKKMLDLLNKYPQCAEIHYELGIYYNNKNILKSAYEHLLKAEKSFPNDQGLKLLLSEIKDKLPVTIENEKDLEKACIEIAKKALAGKKRIDKIYGLGDKLLFDFDSAKINAKYKKSLDSFTKALMTSGVKFRLTIRGYTDNIGTEEYNKELSIKRAQAVKKYMVDHGYRPDFLEVEGHGSKGAIATNETERGRRQNRRVSFKDTN